ncbi:hypothetical protein GGS21DRAFT_543746 [Xylaria nigripes]|nr:hypothetical protein GGS21DRAFT_543746 [Xylaria nigripes]
MSVHTSTNTKSDHGTEETPVSEELSVTFEEADFAQAQMTKEKGGGKFRKAAKFFMRCPEPPLRRQDRGYCSTTSHKGCAFPAYDDHLKKRVRLRHESERERSVSSKKQKKKRRKKSKPRESTYIEISGSDDDDDVDYEPLVSVSEPIAVKARSYTELPTEILHKILRYILLSPDEIPVFHGWSLVFPRSRPCLDISILSTCKVLNCQGLQILYGENTFTYNLRDPVESHQHTRPVLDQIYMNCEVPINKYGHLIRHIKVKVLRSHLHFPHHLQKFEESILKFLPGRGLEQDAELHTLILEIPAVCKRDLQEPREEDFQSEEDYQNEERNTNGDGDQDKVPICQYLLEGSKLNEAILELKVQWVRVLACDRNQRFWETVVDMRYFVKDEHMRLEYTVRNNGKVPYPDECPSNPTATNKPAAAASYRPNDLEVRERLWARRVKRAVKRLRKLARRIEDLAIDPDKAVRESRCWRPAVANPLADLDGDPMSRPQNWREYSSDSSGSSDSSDSSETDTPLESDTGENTGNPANNCDTFNIEAIATTAETNPNDLTFDVPNTEDFEVEARVLGLQQAMQGDYEGPNTVYDC